jgi:glycosyltransferase involved in cell wall biosynthesis
MLVSVVIPNYNYARYLRIAVESVLAQTQECEIIVVDDGSRDDSRSVISTFGDRVRSIYQSNAGVSAARNAGIAIANGEFIGFLDADDVWHPRKIELQLQLFAEDDVGLVHCWTRTIDADGNPTGQACGGARGWALPQHARLETTVNGGGSAALVRRACFQRVGTFDTGLSTSADWDMWRRIMGVYRIDLVAQPLVDYRVHSGAMHHNIAAYERDMSRALARMFADPDASAAWGERRFAYAKLFSTLCADYGLTGSSARSARFGLKSVLTHPTPMVDLLLRRAARLLGVRARSGGRL